LRLIRAELSKKSHEDLEFVGCKSAMRALTVARQAAGAGMRALATTSVRRFAATSPAGCAAVAPAARFG